MIIHIDVTLLFEILLFVVFLAVLNRLFYRPLEAIFRQRAARVEAGLRAAQESERRTEEAQREVQRQLGEARLAAQSTIAAAMKAAEERRQELLAQARTDADARVQSAQAEIQRERAAAVEELRRAAGQIAILAASKVVGKSLDSAANRELANRTIAEILAPHEPIGETPAVQAARPATEASRVH